MCVPRTLRVGEEKVIAGNAAAVRVESVEQCSQWSVVW